MHVLLVAAGCLLLVLCALAFAFYYPIWAGVPMSPDQIHAREYWRAY